MQISRSEAIRIFLASFPVLTSNQVLKGQPCLRSAWQVGGDGGIKADDVILIGLIQVTQGSWKPILQLNRYIL